MTTPFGVYIHFPFCRSRCPYCDFTSVAAKDPPHRAYADALLRELRRRAAAFADFSLSSIYVGGGTPSIWQPDELARVLDGVRRAFPAAGSAGQSGVEVTSEANPADVTPQLLDRLAAAGVDRCSLGVQSFSDRTLAVLGRRHDAAGARRALAMLHASALPRLTFDLICGVPGQSLQDWEEELCEAVGWQRGHVSVYCLTLEPHTPLGRQAAAGELELPDEETSLAMLQATSRVLGQAGLVRYEISNYARPGEESRHNLLYWRLAPYLGLGAGAHSYLPGTGSTPAHRWANTPDPEAYLARPGEDLAVDEQLGPRECAQERLLCALRLREGLDLARHVAAGGEDLRRTRAPALAALENAGLVDLQGDTLSLSEAGFALADAVIRQLAG